MNKLVKNSRWVLLELVGLMCHTERKMFNSVHCRNAFWNILPSVYFLSLPESQNDMQNVSCQNHRNYAWKLQSLPELQNRAIAECLEMKIASAVNQICRFASTKSTRNLTVVCHRNKTFTKDKLNYVFINQIKFGSNLKQYSLSYLSKIDPTQPFQNNGGNSF